MEKVLKNSWALFLGMGALMLAYGFQGSLLGVRAVKEEFSLTATGFMMSGYFVGYFIGAKTIPQIISRVGHIRVFAAFASIASLVVLIHAVYVSPFVWFLLRVLTGISMVSIYTVAESWLNDRASNKNRGSVLSVYMVILYGAMGLGMFLLNFSDPLNFQPFILISVITSAALIPILLTKRKAPTFKKISKMSLREVFISSPFGMVSSFFYGTIQSALFTLLAVYATTMNFSIFQISLVTFLLAISGAISQWPIGKLSDMFDRRKVIIIVTFAAAFFAFCAILPETNLIVSFVKFSFFPNPASRILCADFFPGTGITLNFPNFPSISFKDWLIAEVILASNFPNPRTLFEFSNTKPQRSCVFFFVELSVFIFNMMSEF